MADYSILHWHGGLRACTSAATAAGAGPGPRPVEPPPSSVGGLEGNVRALAVYPDNPRRLLAGYRHLGPVPQ